MATIARPGVCSLHSDRMVGHPETDDKINGREKRRPSRNACRAKAVIRDRRPGRHRHASLKSLREQSFQKLAQLGCRLELWTGIEFLECGSKRIRETPDRPRSEFLVSEVNDLLLHVAVRDVARRIVQKCCAHASRITAPARRTSCSWCRKSLAFCADRTINVARWNEGLSELGNDPQSVCESYDRIAAAYASHYANELQHKPFDRELLNRFAAEVKGRG